MKINVKYVESTSPTDIPDEVYQEATLADAWREVIKSNAKLSATIKHFGHNVDVTEYPYWCSDCQETIR